MLKFTFRSLIFTLALGLIFNSLEAKAQYCEIKNAKSSATSSEKAPGHIPDKAIESSVESENVWFSSLDEAAIQALNHAYAKAHNHKGIEYGGCLFTKTEDVSTKFYYTVPVTNNSSDGIRISCETPSFAKKFVGLFHTHPIDLTIDGFSGHDIEVAETLNVTSYVGSIYSKNILKFESCKTKKTCLNDGGLRCYRKDFSRGEVIGRMK